ncbi:MBOAT family protein [Ruminococcaceae bacterium OttesenSCG-928-A11]|nr:MBOAT family protein [Ruminococcaceae bacterium OttesenSCG-928-A11]
MLFNSVHFLLFFPIVTLVYFIIPLRWRWLWLLAASYYFYMSWNPRYAVLIAFSTVVTWLSGLLVGRAKTAGGRRLWVALSLGLNLAVLFFFKYWGFAMGTLERLLAAANIQLAAPAFDVLLPVGISFYTFQALSYTMDVYRGEVPVEKNILRYALFVSFFPQLVAGPIERSKNLLTQVNQTHRLDYDRLKSGLLIMGVGYFQKMVVADRAAILVDTVFGDHQSYAGPQIIVAALLFAVQIHGDFAGYSSIAIGSARILGFDLMQNFRQPYLAGSIREFWQRWHISLSTWFRDYLYIPMGGSRKGRLRTQLNTMVTFLVSGLWHGASWTFVLWGGLHGAWQVVGNLTRAAREALYARLRLPTKSALWRAGRVAFTFILVDFAWVLFRAPGVTAFVQIVRSAFDFSHLGAFSITGLGLGGAELMVLAGAVLLLAAWDFAGHRGGDTLALLGRQKTVVRWIFYYLLLYVIVRFGVFGTGYTPPEFIYFQF